MEASLVHTRLDTSKIDPFNGTFFKRWQERVFFAMLISSGAPLNLWGKLSYPHVIFKIEYLTRKRCVSWLKQAPKQWHNKFDHVLVTNGYSINDAHKCISTASMRITHV